MQLLFDIGGTKTRVGVSADGQTLGKHLIIPTQQNFTEAIDALVNEANSLANGQQITAIAGGVKGSLDAEKAVLINPPNLPGWKGKNLKVALQEKYNVPIQIDNDAALAGLGEAVYGPGKGSPIVAYLTVSTGFGGTRIINGKLDHTALGFEPGHQVVDYASDLICGCGGKGHLEAQIGGASIEQYKGQKPEDITDQAFWDQITKLLAYGINNTIVMWSPDVIVIGGSLMNKISLEKMVQNVQEICTIFKTIPQIKPAELGDISGLYGALALGQSKH